MDSWTHDRQCGTQLHTSSTDLCKEFRATFYLGLGGLVSSCPENVTDPWLEWIQATIH